VEAAALFVVEFISDDKASAATSIDKRPELRELVRWSTLEHRESRTDRDGFTFTGRTTTLSSLRISPDVSRDATTGSSARVLSSDLKWFR